MKQRDDDIATTFHVKVWMDPVFMQKWIKDVPIQGTARVQHSIWVSAEECDENIFAHTDEDKEDDGDEHDKEDEEEDDKEEDEDKA